MEEKRNNGEKKNAFECDINTIMECLPHRYPFLLVDRIVEVDLEGEEKRAVGIKNVSMNEPFFQGHFPGHPVMPGVLQVEAMAQVASPASRTAIRPHSPPTRPVCKGYCQITPRSPRVASW